MPNHPEIRTYTLTATIHRCSKKIRPIEFAVSVWICSAVGAPKERKLACNNNSNQTQ